MKRILLALVLLLTPSFAWAQCTGVFPSATICGSVSGGVPGPVPTSALTGIAGGSNGQVQYNNAGVFGGLTNTQLTADINLATTSLPGALPAWPNNTTTFFRGDGTYAIPGYPVTALCGLTGAPTATQITACLNLFSSTLQGLVPASGGGTINFLRADGSFAAPPIASVDNLLSNVQWQLFSSVGFIPKYDYQATGTQPAVSCASFQITNNAPTFSCSNTGQVKAGDLVYVTASGSTNFWSFPGVGVLSCVSNNLFCINGLVTSVKVIQVVTNTSILVQAPLGGVSPGTSVASTLTPIGIGDLGTSTRGPDGWAKTSTLIVTPDDFAVNAYPGAYRPLLLVKGITGSETFCWNAPTSGTTYFGSTLPVFTGRTITFGAAVYQKIQGGANTWRLDINDSTGTTSSSNGTGTGAGGYQFLTSTRTIGSTATTLSMCLNTLGNAGDAYYLALPTAAFVPSMVQAQLHQNSHEIIRAVTHWNMALLTPLLSTFPSSALYGSCACYGWNNIDIEAVSVGQVHKSVSRILTKVEWYTTHVGASILTTNNANATYVTFGPEGITQVSGTTVAGGPAWWPVNYDGTIALYTLTSGLSGENLTTDMMDVDASLPTSVN